MKRYKELKYNKKTFTEQWKIDEILIKEGFQWFLDCEVEDVRIEILKQTLVFNSGTFFNGTWVFGAWRGGTWKYGTWLDGVWFNGRWLNGVFKDGIIKDGKFLNGKMEKGTIEGGEFYHIEISKEVKRKDEKKKEVQQQQEDEQIPQGEKITEKRMKKFNEFINEHHDDEEELREGDPTNPNFDPELMGDFSYDNRDHDYDPNNIEPVEPEDIVEPVEPFEEPEIGPEEPSFSTAVPTDYKSSGPSGKEYMDLMNAPNSSKRVIYKNFDEYTKKILGRSFTDTEDDAHQSAPKTRRGIRRKK